MRPVRLAVQAPCVLCGLCGLCRPRASGCAGCVGPARHPTTKSPGRSRPPRPPHLHPTAKPASAPQTFMTRLLPPTPNNQLPNTLPTLMAPSTMGGVRSKRSKCTQGNCKAWRSHDAHEALSAHVKFSTKAIKFSICACQVFNHQTIAPQAAIAPKAAPPRQEVNLPWPCHSEPKSGPFVGSTGWLHHSGAPPSSSSDESSSSQWSPDVKNTLASSIC